MLLCSTIILLPTLFTVFAINNAGLLRLAVTELSRLPPLETKTPGTNSC